MHETPIYVADHLNYRIQKFDINGNFLLKWDWNIEGFPYPEPVGIATDKLENVYIADYYNNCIKKYNSNGDFILEWGSAGSEVGKFDKPFGISTDNLNNVYVSDRENYRIQKFDSNGNFLLSFGSYGYQNGQFYTPKGITVDESGNIYVVDINLHRVQKFDSNGNFILKFGSGGGPGEYGNEDGEFEKPRGIAIDNNAGILYVTDFGNSRVQAFNTNGTFLFKWSGDGDEQFDSVDAISVDSFGNIYVGDFSTGFIKKFDTNRNFLLKWGGNGSENGQFDDLSGISCFIPYKEPEEIINDVILTGSHKYHAATLGSNRMIYGIPDESSDILLLNPDTLELTNIKGANNISPYYLPWYACCLANNNCIYSPPCFKNSNEILKINIKDNIITKFGNLQYTGTKEHFYKWISATLANNGYIYCLPFDETRILKINPTNDTYSFISGLPSEQFGKWNASILAKNGFIYGTPENTNRVIKLNPNTDQYELIGEEYPGIDKWYGSAIADNGKIYCGNLNNSNMLVIDTNNDTTYTIGENIENLYSSPVLANDGRIYCLPFNHNYLLCVDPIDDRIIKYGPYSVLSDKSFACTNGAVAVDGKIYGLPYHGDYFIEVSVVDTLIRKHHIENCEKI